MCSKSHEQQPPVLEEEEEEVEEGYQDFQNYTARFEEQIGMGINNDYYSYTSISPMLHPQQQQPSWMDVANAGSSGDNMMMSSSYLFPPPVPPPLIMSSSGNLFNRPGGLYEGSACMPFGLQAEMGKILTPQEIMDAKALAASKSHSEAERRRRERINNHLAKLRSLLPSTTKTDKASLLAEVIQHVKELKRQTSIIAEQSPVPTESDELTIDKTSDEQGNIIIRASLCCEDRSDLLPDLIKTLKALRLRTLKAEITTLGGRMKNVLFITGDHQDDTSCSIQQAFKAVMDKTNDNNQSSSGTTSSHVKRQRTNNIVNNVLNS